MRFHWKNATSLLHFTLKKCYNFFECMPARSTANGEMPICIFCPVGRWFRQSHTSNKGKHI
jgi:hypothetical protein